MIWYLAQHTSWTGIKHIFLRGLVKDEAPVMSKKW